MLGKILIALIVLHNVKEILGDVDCKSFLTDADCEYKFRICNGSCLNPGNSIGGGADGGFIGVDAGVNVPQALGDEINPSEAEEAAADPGESLRCPFESCCVCADDPDSGAVLPGFIPITPSTTTRSPWGRGRRR